MMARSRVASSRGCTARQSAWARRDRHTSTWAQAIRQAIAKRSVPAAGPAMARARAAIWSAKTGSRPAGRLSPCRTALRDDRALPSGVFGPRLRRPFLRLASRLASLIMPAPVLVIGHRSRFVLAQFKPARKQNLEPRLPSFSRNRDVPDEIKSRVNADHIRPNCSKSTSRDALRTTLGTINTAALCHLLT